MKFKDVRLVKKDDHYEIRYEAEKTDSEGKVAGERCGILCSVHQVGQYLVLCGSYNKKPFKVLTSMEKLIKHIRNQTGISVKFEKQ